MGEDECYHEHIKIVVQKSVVTKCERRLRIVGPVGAPSKSFFAEISLYIQNIKLKGQM